MRYLPKSPTEREEMLAAIEAKSIDDLFSSIPERFRLKQALKLPGPFSEAEVIQYFKERASENSVGYTSFLGAGVYNHLRSVVTDAIIQRGEFLTSYTPYQAEITQGTLQAIFEFQTLMCQLTGQQVANASMWDGSTATTEAVLMAERITGRSRVLVERSLHPEYRDVLTTYAKNSGLHVEEIPYSADGTVDQKILQSMLKDDVGAVVVQSPNFFGAIEPVAALAEIVHASGALLVTTITEGVSLGLVKPPAEADIVAMEGQSFGLAPSYGGPFVGVLASRDKFVRQMPGRLTGQTDRYRRPPWFRPHSCHPRTTYPPRKGDFEHLHEPGAMRPRRDRASHAARQRRLARDGPPELFESSVCAERTDQDSWREAYFHGSLLQRVHDRIAAFRAHGEPRIAEG